MKYLKHTIIAGALAFSTLNVATAAPILNISTDGTNTLLGASRVNVGGTLYDVTFGDGTFVSGSITAFTTSAGALAASSALLNDVFLGKYDNLEYNTNGCDTQSLCGVFTPYEDDGGFINYAGAYNESLEYFDDVTFGGITRGYDTTPNTGATLARWTLSSPAAAVPEPETYAMFLAGLGLLGAVSRRRKQMAAV